MASERYFDAGEADVRTCAEVGTVQDMIQAQQVSC